MPPRCVFLALSLMIGGPPSMAVGESVESLTQQLRAEDPFDAAAAAEDLGRVKPANPLVIRALVDALVDHRDADTIPVFVPVPRKTVASFAADALVEIGADAVPLLVEQLVAGDSSQSLKAIGILESIGLDASAALPKLTTIANSHGSADMRYNALRAIGRISNDPQERVTASMSSLKDSSPDVRGLAARMLGSEGRHAMNAVSDLVNLLDDQANRTHAIAPDFLGTRAVRYDAAQALGHVVVQSEDAIKALERIMLVDTDAEVRVSAALALCRIDGDREDGLEVIVSILGEDRRGTAGPYEAANALESLGKRAESALPDLKRLLKHEDVSLRSAAVHAIAAIGTEEAVFALLVALTDRDRWVQEEAIDSLGSLGETAVSSLPHLIEMRNRTPDAELRDLVQEAIESIDPSSD